MLNVLFVSYINIFSFTTPSLLCLSHHFRFTPVDMSAQLKDVLNGKTVVEFPTFYVALRRDWPKYETAEQPESEPQEQQQLLKSQQQPLNEDLECFLENKECL